VFSVSQIEELGFSHFYEKQKDFLELETYRLKQASYFAGLLVTYVNTELATADFSSAGVPSQITYPNQTANLFELNNVVAILEAWNNNPPTDFPNYAAGTWGPEAALHLIQRDQHHWFSSDRP
jgi:hypothetical protein